METNQKPTSIRRMELIGALSQVINASQLAPYVVEPILADLLRQARENTVRQYQADMAQWKEQEGQAPQGAAEATE